VDVTYLWLTDRTRPQWAFHDCTASSTCSRRVHYLCEGWRHSSSKITLGFLVAIVITPIKSQYHNTTLTKN